MKYIIFLMAIVILFICYSIVYFQTDVVYDCRIAEISPDVPLEVKEECRELMKAEMI